MKNGWPGFAVLLMLPACASERAVDTGAARFATDAERAAYCIDGQVRLYSDVAAASRPFAGCVKNADCTIVLADLECAGDVDEPVNRDFVEEFSAIARAIAADLCTDEFELFCGRGSGDGEEHVPQCLNGYCAIGPACADASPAQLAEVVAAAEGLRACNGPDDCVVIDNGGTACNPSCALAVAAARRDEFLSAQAAISDAWCAGFCNGALPGCPASTPACIDGLCTAWSD